MPIGYCSLVEAFQDVQLDLQIEKEIEKRMEEQQQHTSMSAIPMETRSKLGSEDESILEDQRAIRKVGSTMCADALRHVRMCKECQQRLESYAMLDLGMYVIGGVFLIFILDLAIRYGGARAVRRA